MTKVYLRRRRPCWICSASLGIVTTGARKGQYVGVEVDTGDGHQHLAHESCVTGEPDPKTVDAVIRLRRAARRMRERLDAPPLSAEVRRAPSYSELAAKVGR